MALSVRYYSVVTTGIVDTFYRFVPVHDCTTDTWYSAKKNRIENNLNIENLIGIGCEAE